MSFPLPSLLASIENLLVEVAWLDGIILVTESQTASFLPVAQVNPVLVVRGGGRFWLGIISPCVSRSRSRQQHAVAHLDRCFAKG